MEQIFSRGKDGSITGFVEDYGASILENSSDKKLVKFASVSKSIRKLAIAEARRRLKRRYPGIIFNDDTNYLVLLVFPIWGDYYIDYTQRYRYNTFFSGHNVVQDPENWLPYFLGYSGEMYKLIVSDDLYYRNITQISNYFDSGFVQFLYANNLIKHDIDLEKFILGLFLSLNQIVTIMNKVMERNEKGEYIVMRQYKEDIMRQIGLYWSDEMKQNTPMAFRHFMLNLEHIVQNENMNIFYYNGIIDMFTVDDMTVIYDIIAIYLFYPLLFSDNEIFYDLFYKKIKSLIDVIDINKSILRLKYLNVSFDKTDIDFSDPRNFHYFLDRYEIS